MRTLLKVVAVLVGATFVLDHLPPTAIVVGLGVFLAIALVLRAVLTAQLGGQPPRRFGDG